MSFKSAFVALALLGASAGAHASTLVVDSGERLATISASDPLGQSFLAPGAQLQSIGLQFSTLNPSHPAAALTIELREGAGLTGAVLGSRSFTPGTVPGRFEPKTFTDFDFTGISLTKGAAYTIVVTQSGGSARNAIVFGPDLIDPPFGSTFEPDAYADGSLIYTGSLGGCGGNPASCDLNFRVVTAAVPEPTTWAQMILGFTVLGGAARSRRVKGRKAAAA